MSSACATCTQRCCHHYTVTVTGYDAWVIARGLGMAPEQFLVVVQQREPNERGFMLDQSEQRFDIALDKTPSAGERPCIFWFGLPSGVGRCGIYALRPYVCQTYPAFLAHADAPGRVLIQRREDVLCPTTAWRDGVLDGSIWRHRLLEMRAELSIYALAVARWNQHVRQVGLDEPVTALGYLTYVMHFYSRLEIVRAKMGEAQWSMFCASWGCLGHPHGSPLQPGQSGMEQWYALVQEILEVAGGFFGNDLPADDPLKRPIQSVRSDA